MSFINTADRRKTDAQGPNPAAGGVEHVRESCADCGERPLEIDEGNHVIRGVKVLGANARNKGRKYPRRVIEAARQLYQNKPVNINHPRNDDVHRDFNERFGWLDNVRMGDDGLYADLHFNPEHEKAAAVLWFARHNPRMLGLSPDHSIRESVDPKDGARTVTEIVRVHAVDLVADPSTTNGLKEALAMEPLAATETNAGLANPSRANAESFRGNEELEALRRSGDPTIQALVRQIDVLSVREAAHRRELDEFRVRESASARRDAAIERCRTALLPDYAVTEVFIDDLVKCEPAGQDKLIADRNALLANGNGKPAASLAREAVERLTPTGKPVAAPSVDEFIKEVRG
jgi:hypothetical protein